MLAAITQAAVGEKIFVNAFPLHRIRPYFAAMFRKVICFVILASMFLHCASRLGVLSHLYEKRHHIAYALGLIHEVPIATCSNDYDFQTGLVLHEQHDADQTVPQGLAHAPEIILCTPPAPQMFGASPSTLLDVAASLYADRYYRSPLIPVFRPPCLLS